MADQFTYPTVEAYFKAEYPHLVSSLSNGADFWPRVADNSIPNEELDYWIDLKVRIGATSSYTHQARVALRNGRAQNKIYDPG